MVLKCSHLRDKDIIWNTIIGTHECYITVPLKYVFGAPCNIHRYLTTPHHIQLPTFWFLILGAFIMYQNKILIWFVLQKYLRIHLQSDQLTEVILRTNRFSENLTWTILIHSFDSIPFTVTWLREIMDTQMLCIAGSGVPPYPLLFFLPQLQYQKVILYKQEAVKHDHYLIFRTALWTWMYFPSTRNFRSEVSGLSNSFFRDSATVKKSSCSTI